MLICTAYVHAQAIDVAFSINTSLDTAHISPFIYGANALTVDRDVRITARRLGGNRMTGYNWENNASNAGLDYIHESDDYMTWIFGIPLASENIPGITLTAFHDTSRAQGCYTLLTLPAAGYVARDKDGTVSAGQTAPSYRWREVRNFKGSPLTTNPDTSDGFVYVDEEVNALVQRYGLASTPTGVKAYSIDNEPALWPSTHPRIHPDTTRCRELIAKVAGAARAVKAVDPSAEVFGGVFYGFGEYYHMQWAPDWNQYASYENFAAALLGNLRDSSIAAGRRLLDVLDMHWYPDLYTPIINENTDSLTVANRMQAPRTLWDSTYVETGWIGQYYHPESAAILRRTQRIIGEQYPGTKLAVTEFNYGGSTHISGGIAMADVLGIFGANRVYFASLWGDIAGYIASGYRMYTNYDAHGGTYGDLSVHATSSDNLNSSIHVATSAGDPSTLHIIAINKNLSRTINAHFVITSDVQFASGAAYGLTSASTSIQSKAGISSIQGNQFTYALPPLSVYHLVLSGATEVSGNYEVPESFALGQNFPNPFNPSTTIRYDLPSASDVHLKVFDILGREIVTLVDEVEQAGSKSVEWNAANLSGGVYFYQVQVQGLEKPTVFTSIRKAILLK